MAPPGAACRRHDTTLRGLRAEQLSFAAAALFLWIAILGGDARERAARAGTGVIALVLTFAHMTMLGVLIALAPRDCMVTARARWSISSKAAR